VDFELTRPGITLDIVVQRRSGQLDVAQVFLFDDRVDVTNVKDLNRAFSTASKKGAARVGFTRSRRVAAAAQPDPLDEDSGPVEQHVRHAGVPPGKRSVCVIPVSGDLKDPETAKRVNANLDALPVHCSQISVAADPPSQRVVVRVP
jgi:hypothetical protein